LFNYVLAETKGKISSYRLSRIKDMALINEVRVIKETNKEIYNKLIDYGPQYTISEKEEKVKIQLTKEGEKLYKKIYLYRPKYIEKDGDIYTFDCSYNQILFYFARLGKDAIILEPESLRAKMRFNHKDAYTAYTDKNKKHD
jgi:predicted DNA-binding transcriptional regulator YafY